MKSLLLCGLSLSLVVLLHTGCTTKVAVNSPVESTAIYRWGTLTGKVPGDLSRTFRATNVALDELGYFRTAQVREAKYNEVYARAIKDFEVKVRIEPIEPGISIVAISYGSWGDLAESQRIFDKINEVLPRIR